MSSSTKTTKRKLLELFFTVGTICGTAAVIYSVVHNPIAIVFAAALLVHELGHYFVARYHRAKVDLPFFIPLFPFLIGVTRIRDLKPESIPAVALAGPISALTFILLLIFFNSFFHLLPFVPLIMFFIFESIFNYFGSDGKKYRKYKTFVHT